MTIFRSIFRQSFREIFRGYAENLIEFFNIRWVMGLPEYGATFICTSAREIWTYSAFPSAVNTPILQTITAGVQAVQGAIWDGVACYVAEGMHPFMWDFTPEGIKRVYTEFATYAVSTAYGAGVQVAIRTTAGNWVYMTSSGGTSDATAVVIADSDIGGAAVADNDINWTVVGYATLHTGGEVLEDAATKRALWNRDLTNASWAKTNVTVVKDATGTKGDANSASTLTAIAGNGTVLQTVTIASADFAFAPYIKRKTGIGTIEVTIDNGGTWTDITADINSNYFTRGLATKEAANPIFGFRIATSGDEIEVDFCDMEAGLYGTSPQETTTGAVVRDATSFSNTTAGRLSAASGAGRIILTPSGINQSAMRVFSTYVDGSNYFEILDNGSGFLCRSRVSDSNVQIISTYVYAVGTPCVLEWCWDGVNLCFRVYSVGDAAPAFTEIAETRSVQISATFTLGIGGATTGYTGNYLVCQLSTNQEDLNFE